MGKFYEAIEKTSKNKEKFISNDVEECQLPDSIDDNIIKNKKREIDKRLIVLKDESSFEAEQIRMLKTIKKASVRNEKFVLNIKIFGHSNLFRISNF